MLRIVVVLFWLSLIIGTYVTGNVLGNWVVCLLALFFFVRSRRRRHAAASPPRALSTTSPGGAGSRAGPPVATTARTSLQAAPHPGGRHPERRRWR